MKENIFKRIIAIIVALSIALTGGALIGDYEVQAASSDLSLHVTSIGETTFAIKWNKLSHPGNGYAVFRNSKLIKRLNKKTLSYEDRNLKRSKKYTYQIKTYKKSSRKMYYNKKTKKWQFQKPKAKYLGKVKKKTTYKYITLSNKVSKTKQDTKKFAPYGPYPKKIYDCDGEKRTLSLKSSNEGIRMVIKHSYGYSEEIEPNKLAQYDRNIDGSFKKDGVQYIQKDGLAIGMRSKQPDPLYAWYELYVQGKNADLDKVEFKVKEPTEKIKTSEWDPDATKANNELCHVDVIEKDCVLSGDRRLATFEERHFKNKKSFVVQCKLHDGTGFREGQIHMQPYYDGKPVFSEFVINIEGTTTENYDIAKQAIAEHGDTGSYEGNMNVIVNYIRTNYPYKEFNCWRGEETLAEYSAVEYGIYGFSGPGSSTYMIRNKEGEYVVEYGPNYPYHAAFHLNDRPLKHFETNGYH